MSRTVLDLLDGELRKARGEFGHLQAAVHAYRTKQPFVAPSIDRDWALNTLACASVLAVHRRLVYVLEIILERIDGYKPDADDEATRAQAIKAAAQPVPGLREAVISEHLRDTLLRLEWFFEEVDGRYPVDLDPLEVFDAVTLLRHALILFSDEFSHFKQSRVETRQADFFEPKA